MLFSAMSFGNIVESEFVFFITLVNVVRCFSFFFSRSIFSVFRRERIIRRGD